MPGVRRDPCDRAALPFLRARQRVFHARRRDAFVPLRYVRNPGFVRPELISLPDRESGSTSHPQMRLQLRCLAVRAPEALARVPRIRSMSSTSIFGRNGFCRNSTPGSRGS